MTPAACTACPRCPAAEAGLPPAAPATADRAGDARSPGGLTPVCVGLSFRTAPIALRERVAMTESEVASALTRFGCPVLGKPAGLEELAILTTCNRFEVYAATRDSDPEPLLRYVSELRGVDIEELRSHSYLHGGEAAVEHLLRVSAGLDSMIIGEAQILSQVGRTLEESERCGSSGPVTVELLRDAIRTGRRARAETGINRNPATISSVAVALAASRFDDMPSANVLIIGAGEMGRLAAQALHDRGVRKISILGRSLERAAGLAGRFGAAALTREGLNDALVAADVVISATSAPQFIVERGVIVQAMSARPDRRLVLLDIALPRDIDPAAGEVPGVTLFSIDDLRHRMQATLAERRREVPAVERIVAEEARDYVSWLRQLDVAPVIIAVRSRAEEIRRDVLDDALVRLPNLSDADRARIDAFSKSFVQKLLHSPTVRLKEKAADGWADEYARAMRQLFGVAP
jgi:glutamyl-tRNA reductase